jgi:hypothetical protein
LPELPRRDFLLLKLPRDQRSCELSCEWLLMKFLDAEAAGTTDDLFARLAHDLEQLDELRLTQTSWLTRDDLRERLENAMVQFRARGGLVTVLSPPSA